MPEVNREDVIVRQDKDGVQVTGWTPACGDHAGLDLFILIDDAVNTSLGSQLGDLRAFINAQPPTTSVEGGTCGMGRFKSRRTSQPPGCRFHSVQQGETGSGSISGSRAQRPRGHPGDRRRVSGRSPELLEITRVVCGRFPRWLYATTG